MKRFIISMVLAIALMTPVANAEEDKSFLDNKGEYVTVQFRNNKTFLAVIAKIKEAGYNPLLNVGNLIPATTKMDTWCKVNPWNEKDIIVECYTPHLGHAISVRDHVHDSSQILKMLEQVRKEHRQASELLGIK